MSAIDDGRVREGHVESAKTPSKEVLKLSCMASRIPHVLSAYLQLPPELSLTLITSVLGASSNWLTIRFLCATLGGQVRSRSLAPHQDHEAREEKTGVPNQDGSAVVLVSWMREYAFWQQELRKAGVGGLHELHMHPPKA